MPTTTGYLRTEHASKYLQQLCKHFAHKIEVEYNAEKGWAAFAMGTAHMIADDDRLTVTCDVADTAAIAAVHSVIDSHLKKFAFRDAVNTMTWTASETA